MKRTWTKTMLLASLVTTGAMANEGEVLPEPGADLLVWTDGNSQEYMQKAASEFNKEFGYNVKFSYREMSAFESGSRMIQDSGSARVADVAEVPHDNIGRLVTAGSIMENLVSADDIESRFIPSAIAASKYQNVGYGFPISYATIALFYNKDLMPEAPTSFEEIIEFSKTFNDKKENKYALLFDIQNYYESRMFLALHGGYEFGDNGSNPKDIGINSEAAQKGLTAMMKLREANNSNTTDMRNPQVRRGLFGEGKVAAIIDGPWAIDGYKASGINFGVTPIPTLEGKNPRSFTTVQLAVVSSYSEYPKAAQLFAKYLTTDKMLKLRFEMTKAAPPVEKVLEEILLEADEATYALIAQGFHADAMPSIPEMGYIWSPMNSAMTSIWVNSKSPKEVLDQAKAIIEEQISFQE